MRDTNLVNALRLKCGGGKKMKRLTERDTNCADPKEIYGVRVKNHDYISAANRLADYEDTELTPEEVLSMKFEWCAMMDALNSIGGGYTRLRELAEADRDGRLVVLPAKTVFELTWDAGPDCDLICPVSVDGEDCCSFCDKGELCIYERKCRQEHIEQIGKTVFLTREAAEKALEAKSNA